MPWNGTARIGMLAALLGTSVFLPGAFVVTTDARHHGATGAVHAEIFIVAVGLVLLAVSRVVWILGRAPHQEGGGALPPASLATPLPATRDPSGTRRRPNPL